MKTKPKFTKRDLRMIAALQKKFSIDKHEAARMHVASGL